MWQKKYKIHINLYIFFKHKNTMHLFSTKIFMNCASDVVINFSCTQYFATLQLIKYDCNSALFQINQRIPQLMTRVSPCALDKCPATKFSRNNIFNFNN